MEVLLFLDLSCAIFSKLKFIFSAEATLQYTKSLYFHLFWPWKKITLKVAIAEIFNIAKRPNTSPNLKSNFCKRRASWWSEQDLSFRRTKSS